MRFLAAAILFVASATLILLGLAQRTIWHPPAHHVSSVTLTDHAPLIVIKHSFLAQYPGEAIVTAKGAGRAFLAYGRQSDIDAWVGHTSHIEVSALTAGTNHKTISLLRSGSGEKANPSGSDLWRGESSNVGAASLKVNPSDREGVLIAGDGFTDAPQTFNVVWPINFDSTPSTILISVGGVLLVGATILNWMAWYRMRKDRGPRRRLPKAPQGPRIRRRRIAGSAPTRGRRSARNLKIAAGSLILVTSLTGCSSPDQASTAKPTGSPDTTIQQPAVINQVQAREIVRRIALAVQVADAARDPKLLKGRVAGPALDARTAHYKLQKASKKAAAPTPIAYARISLLLPAATNLWPRTVMVISSSGEKDALPQMLVLQQKSPRSQYNLWYNINMLPGAKLPMLNNAATGSIPVASNSLFLKIAPDALPTSFGDLIDNGQSSLSAPMFDVSNDEYYKQIYDSQQSQAQTLANATIKTKHLLGNPNVLSLSTVDSGALVAVYMNDKYVIKPKDKTKAVAVAGNEKLMLGSAGSATGVKSIYGSMLLFYVPGIASKDKIRTLGATQELLSVVSM